MLKTLKGDFKIHVPSSMFLFYWILNPGHEHEQSRDEAVGCKGCMLYALYIAMLMVDTGYREG